MGDEETTETSTDDESGDEGETVTEEKKMVETEETKTVETDAG